MINVSRDYDILILNDEENRVPIKLLEKFKIVIRVVFARGVYPSNVITVPLYVPMITMPFSGYFAAREQHVKDAWCFAGDGYKNEDRRSMLKAFSSISPNVVHSFHGWLPQNALQPADYAHMLSNSLFVPCPAGTHHVECYRAYEACRLDSIPVVTSTYYNELFDAPFPTASNWTMLRYL